MSGPHTPMMPAPVRDAAPHHGQQTMPHAQDSLRGALEFFLRYYRLSHTVTSVLTGLPLRHDEKGRAKLTPGLFVRAAGRAGMAGRVVRRNLVKVSPHVLPAVLMLRNGQAVVINNRKGDGNEHDTIETYDPLTGKLLQWPSLAALEAEAVPEKGGLPYLIYVKMGLRMELTQETRMPAKQWFWSTLNQFRPLYAKVLLAAAVINMLGLMTSLFVMHVYDRVVPNAAFETLWVLAFGVVLGYLFEFAFRQLRSYFVDTAGKGADILLSSKVYSQVLNSRMGNRPGSAGAFANQVRDYESVREFFTSGTVTALVDVPFMLVYVFVIFLLGGQLALVPMVAVPLVIALSWSLQQPMREMLREVAQEMDLKHGHLIETINGLENIKAIGSQSHAQGRWEQLTGVGARLNTKTRFIHNLGVHLSSLLPNLAYVSMVVWGVHLIINGQLTTGALVASTMLLTRGMAPVAQVAGLTMRYQQVRASLDALTSLMTAPVERPEGKDYVHVQKLDGSIKFNGVAFSYPNTKLNSLETTSFNILPGERVGIIGRAGSGKSTIARLIMGLYEPGTGGILLDNLDLRQMDPAEVRKNICYFPQNLYLFRGTLRENLMLAAPEARDDDLLKAVEVSGAYRLIRRHPMGFDLPIGERGENLSGGQRQAVGLARALMHDGQIAVFDDPTSEMDASSETWVKERLQKWLKNRTLILITHRPSMLELVDRLLVIDEGRLIADGPKQKILELLASGKIKGRE